MGVHSFLWVWVSASQRIPLSVLARNPHEGLVCEISCETGRRRGQGRSQGSRQKKAVRDSRRKATVWERQLVSEELGPVDPEAGSASVREWVSVPGSCVEIFKYTLVTDTEAQNTGKVSTPPLLALGAKPTLFLFFVLFFHALGCVCCVFVK